MKEKFIFNFMGMDIIARVPFNYPLGDDIQQKQLDRAEEMITKIIQKEYRMPSEKEIAETLGIRRKNLFQKEKYGFNYYSSAI